MCKTVEFKPTVNRNKEVTLAKAIMVCFSSGIPTASYL